MATLVPGRIIQPGVIDAKADSVANVHADIDARLDRIRASLDELVPQPPQPPSRPTTAPAQAKEPPRRSDEHVLLYMPFFETQQIRAARRAQRSGSAAPRRRPPLPGKRPLGYRIDAVHPSSPAYSFAQKIVLSANVDPLLPDDGPGPGAYDLLKY